MDIVSAREDRIADGMAAVDAGLERTLTATNAVTWAEGALAGAEQVAKGDYRYHLAFIPVFGQAVEVKWDPACCIHEGDNCRPAHYTYWHAGQRKSREEVIEVMVEVAITEAGNVEAAMVCNLCLGNKVLPCPRCSEVTA